MKGGRKMQTMDEIYQRYAVTVYKFLLSKTGSEDLSEEPCSWTMMVVNNIGSSQRQAKEEYMLAYGYAILALIDNLSEVQFEYEVDGEKCVLSVNTEEASVFAEEDIKEIGKDITKLQTLIEKTVLYTENGRWVGDSFMPEA